MHTFEQLVTWKLFDLHSMSKKFQASFYYEFLD